MAKDETEEIYQIFDKIFKKILTLSSLAVINLINGLFDTDYPTDSKVTYNWTEFIGDDEKMKRILADTILTINDRFSYHLEAQIEKDNSIVFRVFEYSFGHADRTRSAESGKYMMRFPRPVVIYLYYEGNVPDEYELTLEFEEGRESYAYKVPVLKLKEISAQELNDRKLVILIPFHLLKLRDMVKRNTEKSLSEDNLKELQNIIENDIIRTIEANKQAGNLETADATKLIDYTRRLWNYLSRHYKELEVCGDMTDESFMTEVDILCEEYEKKIEQAEKKIEQAEKKIEQAEKDGREAGRQEGREAGRQEGRQEGRVLYLIKQVCRKLQKGNDVRQIADILEEDVSEIENICRIAEDYAPDYNVELIYDRMQSVGV